MKDEPEQKPTEAQVKKFMDDRCRAAFYEYKETGRLIDNGGVKFTHLKQSGIITLTPERYAEIFEKAKQLVITEATATIYKSGSDSTAGAISREVLKRTDSHEVTKNAARLIALREYFDFLIENEFNLTDFLPIIND